MNKNINTINRKRCIIALITSSIIVIVSFIGIVKKLLMPYVEGTAIFGKDVFRYFTVISCLLINFTSTLCIPFEIQGLLKHNYHLPRWIVDFLYLSTVCTTMTFMISLFVIAPVSGIYETFIEGTLIYMHTLCPILALILFLTINVDHKIKNSRLLISLLPMSIYIIVYYYEVYILTEANGGWVDHYYIKENISVALLFVIVVITNLIVSFILFKIHNNNHIRFKKEFTNYYLNSKDFEFKDIKEAIEYLAIEDKKIYKEGDVVVPTRIIEVLKNRYNSNLSDNELYLIYINTFNS